MQITSDSGGKKHKSDNNKIESYWRLRNGFSEYKKYFSIITLASSKDVKQVLTSWTRSTAEND